MHSVAPASSEPASKRPRPASECPICTDDVNIEQATWTPCCLGVFHEDCLAKVTSCPLCRNSLGPEVVDLVTDDEEESTSDEDSMNEFIVDDASSDDGDASWHE